LKRNKEGKFEERGTMKISEKCLTLVFKLCFGGALVLASLVSAHGQKYEITPLVGATFWGTLKLEHLGVRNFDAHVGDSFSYGVAGGFRFDAEDCERCNLIETRWLRQNTHLGLRQNLLVPTPVTAAAFHPSVKIDRFLGDFTREWNIQDVKIVKPFLTASIGVARMSTPASNATRFVFGMGTGFKIFPKPHWGIRFQVEYLPIVPAPQRVVCAVSCIVALGGGVMNQLELNIGPAFRF